MNSKTKFSWKAFISIGLFYSFFILFITGIILYLTPTGRVAHWENWTLFGFRKEDWEAIHIIFSLVFIILSIFHLFSINWKVFLKYLKNKRKTGINKNREFYLASIFTFFIFIGVILSIPPFSSIIDFGDYLSASWENKDTQPPIPHTELLMLNELPEKFGNISIDKITNKLKENSIKYNNTNETLAEIGELNNLSPIEIYNIIFDNPPKGIGRGRGNGRGDGKGQGYRSKE